MQKAILFLFLLWFTNMSAQMTIETNEKSRCIRYDDQEECFREPVKTTFYIDISLNKILQEEDSQKTLFTIDSKAIPNSKTLIYSVHTATGERLTITISDRSVKIQSLNYKDQYTQFDL